MGERAGTDHSVWVVSKDAPKIYRENNWRLELLEKLLTEGTAYAVSPRILKELQSFF